MRRLTSSEKAAIARLRAALKDFPETLTLHAGTGGLNVVMNDPATGHPYLAAHSRKFDERWDSDAICDNFPVRADGGDPW